MVQNPEKPDDSIRAPGEVAAASAHPPSTESPPLAQPTAEAGPEAPPTEIEARPDAGESTEAGERRKRRGRRGGRRHKPRDGERAAADAPPDEASGEAGPDAAPKAPVQPASVGGPEDSSPGGAAADGDGSQGETKPSRRRRGHRGGARRSKAAQPEDAADSAKEPAAEAAPEAPAAVEEPPAPRTEAEPEPAPDAEAPARKRRSRRSRSRKRSGAEAGPTEEEAPTPVPAAVAAEPALAEAATESVPADAEPQASAEDVPATKPKRRRGRRKKAEPAGGESAVEADAVAASAAGVADYAGDSAVTEAHAADEVADAKADERAEEREPGRKEAWTGSRRRRRPVGAPPREEKHRVLLASESPDELRVAVVEDERLAEVYLQRAERPSILGNVYQARVQNVLRGMDAAFVDFGLEKSGFLHVDEVEVEDAGPRHGRRITQLLQPGQQILVQIIKDPMKGKGARLTTRVTLAGRYVVYVPGGEGVGVSRRLSQEERDRLRDACKSLRVRKAGLIVRTVAEGKGVEELRRDVQYLSRQWSRIKAKAEKKVAPALIHEEVDVTLEAARDLFNDGYRAYIVDSPKVHKRLVAYLERVAPELVSRVELYEDPKPLFESYGVEEGIEATLQRRVSLPSGGNLVIDHTEALTVIDVNSGRYTGGSGLEDTITRTNLDAATEVVRQLRLRDIGGIIVIDFIDMARRENRAAVLAKLEHELALDRTKSYVVEISPLGLVEMTRQSTTEGTRGLMTTVCPACHSTGRVLSADTMSRDVERALRRQLPQLKGHAVLVEVQRAVADRLEKSERMRQLERESGRRVFFEGSSTLPIDAMSIVASGTVAEVEAQRLPVREGDEIEVEIRHGLPFSPEDGVAVVNGYQLVVRGGRRFVGSVKRVRVDVAERHGGLAVIPGNGRRRGSN